ncbi:MAG TPA: hypothetical protein PKA77_11990 [Chitinophagaceae bacterium]|jgi:hypothetical protein|nr:hypothetical protein [Chitinophagaceae bacterium]HMU58752.1 hypothetical protein [Chitinophagaceae bacterium]
MNKQQRINNNSPCSKSSGIPEVLAEPSKTNSHSQNLFNIYESRKKRENSWIRYKKSTTFIG